LRVRDVEHPGLETSHHLELHCALSSLGSGVGPCNLGEGEAHERGHIMVAFGGVRWAIDGRNPQPWIGVWEIGQTIDLLRSLAGHFAVAASQLASEDGVSPVDAARYRAAEALLRGQAADCGLRPIRDVRRGPFVRLANGETPPLTVLFAKISDRQRWQLPLRSIDPGLVLLIREMLIGLKWYLPDEEEDPERSPRR
jgi:hypothetical protein